ncbi:hypothetical protein PtA15_10A530 [Puccinia triticina]|uniref:SET domain-containing protein n=1 Tax=Puccinia triticina TaxID=208348 RepID=A0ABY7CUZ0_9BASI|nr:uncharacterized protein PtA15_10A530 [Puccinia triticina]WAQ89106.1 hypothetical protein PtA15_10A530 [Puccinia triticina]
MLKHSLALLALTYPHILLPSYGSNSDFFGLPMHSQAQQRHHNRWANSTHLICKPQESPFFSSSKNSVYKYDKVVPPANLVPFRAGFYKSTCFEDPTDKKLVEYCIFINPTINHGQGMVIVTPTELFEDSLDDGLDLSDDPLNPQSLKVVPMPEKGGLGALAARNLQNGDIILQTRPVAILASTQPIWGTSFGRSIRRQAIDHLPIQTRAAFASLHGEGETEDDFVSSIVDSNMFVTRLFGDQVTPFGAVALHASRLNHACRPNAVYYVDHETQLLRLSAFESISIDEELTISYRSLEMTRSARRKDLQESYGFSCTCSHCQMSAELGELSDRRLVRIVELRTKYFREDPKFSAEDANELIQLCETERIPWCMTISHIIAAEFYNSLGHSKKVKEHAEITRSMGLLLAGSHWTDRGEVDLLLTKPEKHNSHFSRR